MRTVTQCLKPKEMECPKFDGGACKSRAGCRYQETEKNRRMTKQGIRSGRDANVGVNHPFGV